MGKNLKVGDRVSQRFGPFDSVWEVTEVNDRGAVLNYTGPVVYVGYDIPMAAPDGTQLTQTPREGFVGRALWDNVQVIK